MYVCNGLLVYGMHVKISACMVSATELLNKEDAAAPVATIEALIKHREDFLGKEDCFSVFFDCSISSYSSCNMVQR